MLLLLLFLVVVDDVRLEPLDLAAGGVGVGEGTPGEGTLIVEPEELKARREALGEKGRGIYEVGPRIIAEIEDVGEPRRKVSAARR